MFQFSRSDQRGCLVGLALMAAIALGIVADRFLLSDNAQMPSLDELMSDSTATSSASSQDSASRSIIADESFYPLQTAAEPEVFRFDPNLADSIELMRLGFNQWQIRNIYKYRSLGGRFHRVEDMKRIYGMTPELFERISPYAYISRQFRYYEDMGDTRQHDYPRQSYDTSDYAHHTTHDKFNEHVRLDLNAADTATLMRIPGIGQLRAQRIFDYREALGGFVTPKQLYEIDGLPAGIERWFTVEMGVFRKININTDDVRTMSRHPYLSYGQARAIERLRRAHEGISHIRELQLLDIFTEEDITRLEPYIAY